MRLLAERGRTDLGESGGLVEAEFGVLVQLASQCHHVIDDSRGGIQQVVHHDIMAEQGLVVGTGPRGATMRR